MGRAAVSELTFQVQDVTGQRVTSVREVPADSTVGELIDSTLAKMKLPGIDSKGRPMVYQARLEREGRHLHDSERVSDAVQNDDRVVLLPTVEAGGHRPA